MICDKCGSKIDEKSTFCPKCGNIISKENEQINNNLNIFNTNIENNKTKESLIEKYKTNINFFKLSDDNQNNNQIDSNHIIDEPIFPENSFETINQTNSEEKTQMIKPLNITPVNNLINNINDSENSIINQDNSLNNFTDTDSITQNSLTSNNELYNEKTNNNPAYDNNLIYNPAFDTNLLNNIENQEHQDEIVSNNNSNNENNLIYNELPDTSSLNNKENQTDIITNNNQTSDKLNTTNKNEIKQKSDKNNNLIIFIALAFLAIIVVAVVIINGNEKTLTCSINSTEDSLKSNSSISATFKDNNIKSMIIKGSEIISDNSKEYIDLYFDYKTEELNKYTQISGVKVTTNKNGSEITYSVTGNKDNSKQLFEEEFGKIEINAENFVAAAEAQGYKCNAK